MCMFVCLCLLIFVFILTCCTFVKGEGNLKSNTQQSLQRVDESVREDEIEKEKARIKQVSGKLYKMWHRKTVFHL